ncbi:CPBP family glutamic-type intramembrane protease [Amaricoccus sp.]|uniref:CPBP family glutamic-type intramembrane protease n=1 Tax=Amaricoccus sp. TaxID=1872485 RepID=UPI001B451B59|nr:CPBP family glutamic-type intramembrane protease [Amaricoccus sp.]MBP7000717.1 CPBP family intramembrane metalloprotease [Amaricoccus sp.]
MPRAGIGRAAEGLAVFVAAPLAMAFALPPAALFPALFAMTAVGAILLARTPGFAWRSLVRGPVPWGSAALVGLAAAIACGALVWALVPAEALALPRRAPVLWLAILVLYPLLSALPQELLFRPLFFRRYGALFPSTAAAVAANALAFGFAHLMFWNWLAVGLSAVGGLIFALGYLRHGFPTAVALHAVCGGVVFTSGLGRFFYHGAVGG